MKAEMDKTYRTESFAKEIDMATYIKDYVNVEEFIQYCKECPSYQHVWSCPPYDFDPMTIWNQFSSIYIIARKIIFQEGTDPDKAIEIMAKVKEELSQELYIMEKENPGSLSLSAGSCKLCQDQGCTRPQGKPCRYPEKMRYSIESIGGNVGLTVSKLMGIELEWITEGRTPSYFVLVSALMKK